MSPTAKLPVEDNGGLTVDQIDLRIAASEKKTREDLTAVWAKAMDEHTQKVAERFGIHEEKDKLRTDKQNGLVTSRLDSQDAVLAVILAEVKAARAQSDAWHVEDVSYRTSTDNRLGNLEEGVKKVSEDVRDVNTKLNFVDWFVSLCKGVAWTSDHTIRAVKGGKELWIAVGTIVSSLTFIWAFFRPDSGMLTYIIEALRHWAKTH